MKGFEKVLNKDNSNDKKSENGCNTNCCCKDNSNDKKSENGCNTNCCCKDEK